MLFWRQFNVAWTSDGRWRNVFCLLCMSWKNVSSVNTTSIQRQLNVMDVRWTSKQRCVLFWTQAILSLFFLLRIAGYVVTNHFIAITTITRKCFVKFFGVNSNSIHHGGITSPRTRRFDITLLFSFSLL